MYLVDTCGWIEWMIDSPLAKNYSRYLASTDTLIVPTLVQHELYKWLYREIDQATALSAIAATQTATIIPFDTSLALLAADTAREFKLATADASSMQQLGSTTRHWSPAMHISLTCRR